MVASVDIINFSIDPHNMIVEVDMMGSTFFLGLYIVDTKERLYSSTAVIL